MELTLLILCLLISGFFSGAETVFLTVNLIRLEGFLHRKKIGAKAARWFLEKPSRFVLTTQVGTNLASIAFSSLLTAYLSASGVASGWILLYSTLSVLIIAEIIPKSLARDLADRIVLWVAPMLRLLQIVIYPAVAICRGLSGRLLTLSGVDREEVRLFFTRRDLEILIQEGVKTGDLHARHESLISRVLRLPELTARDVMTPRTEMVALEKGSTLEDLRNTVLASGYSKIPIYDQDLDHLLGVAYARDLLDNPPDLAGIIKPITFIPDQKRAVDAFRELRRRRQSMAIAVDEWGGTAGVVTVEDVIEELTGDIEDEYDRTQAQVRQLRDGRWVVRGRIEIAELNERLNLNIPDGDYTTLAGYLIHRLERIPANGETFELESVEYKISRASANRVAAVVVRKGS